MQTAGVLEVITPALSASAVTDPNIDSLQAGNRYLHTSPEFPMKRLLAAYGVDIYQLASVFRDGEQGRLHNCEFTLLEWYRCGFDHHALMDDVSILLQQLWEADGRQWHPPDIVAYGAVVEQHTGLSLEAISIADIQTFFDKHNRSYPASLGKDLDAALDLFFDEFILPEFATDRATFLTDYPASQAALAKIGTDAQGNPVAQRFELYWGTLELANGFHELTDASEQRARFEQDQIKREQMGKATMPMDEAFIQGLQHGLPECAGVAVGIDRLMMLLTGATHISAVMAFDGSRA